MSWKTEDAAKIKIGLENVFIILGVNTLKADQNR